MRELKKIKPMEKFTILKQSVFILCSIFLSGCVGMSSKFDCDVASGGKCAPMNHINQMANYGAFAEKPFKADNLKLAEVKDRETKQKIYGAIPIRSNEEIQQIWIGPYEDANGNYHEASSIYSVIKKGRWVNDPVSATTE